MFKKTTGTLLVGCVLFLFAHSFATCEAAAATGPPSKADARLDSPNPEGISFRSFPVKGNGEQRASAGDLLRAVSEAKGLDVPPMSNKDHTCVTATFSCNSTGLGTLTTHDCAVGDGTFFDAWEFSGTSGTEITANLTSGNFDTFLLLADPTDTAVASDDDGGSGTNSRIAHTLDSTGTWTFAVNNFFMLTGDPGNYELELDCSGGGGPTPPAAPTNLSATALSSTEIAIDWIDASDNEDDFQVQMRSGGSFQTIGTNSANTTGGTVSGLQPATTYDFRVRARNSAGNSAWSNVASATTQGGGGGPDCGDPTVLCLNNDRFAVEVDWRDFSGTSGEGSVVSFSSADSGIFWFFTPDNWEMMVKVLRACGNNNHFWVFAAATTNVEYTLRVTDTQTGVVRTYFNPLGNAAAAITDTQAFATCP